MAAPTLISSESTTTGATTTVLLGTGAASVSGAILAGDLLVVDVANGNNNSTISDPSGETWTLDHSHNDGTRYVRIWSRIATAADATAGARTVTIANHSTLAARRIAGRTLRHENGWDSARATAVSQGAGTGTNENARAWDPGFPTSSPGPGTANDEPRAPIAVSLYNSNQTGLIDWVRTDSTTTSVAPEYGDGTARWSGVALYDVGAYGGELLSTMGNGIAYETPSAAKAWCAVLYTPVAGVNVAGNQATETDTANAGTAAVATAGALSTETDTPNVGTPSVAIPGNLASETDTANAGTSEVGDGVNGNLATETDTPNAGTPAVAIAGSLATEVDAGDVGTPRVVIAGSPATETDTANAGSAVVGSSDVVNGNLAVETDTASGGSAAVTVAGNLATETDSAHASSSAPGVAPTAGVIYLDLLDRVQLDVVSR